MESLIPIRLESDRAVSFRIAPCPHLGGPFIDPRRRTLGVVLRLRSPVERQRVRSGPFRYHDRRELELELGSWQLGGLFWLMPFEDLADTKEGAGIRDLSRQCLL